MLIIPQGGAVAGGKLRGIKVTVRFKILVQLIFNHAGFDTNPSLLRVDFEYAVHMAGHIDDDPRIQRLAVGPGAAAARGKDQRFEAFFGGESRQQDDIRRRAGK